MGDCESTLEMRFSLPGIRLGRHPSDVPGDPVDEGLAPPSLVASTAVSVLVLDYAPRAWSAEDGR